MNEKDYLKCAKEFQEYYEKYRIGNRNEHIEYKYEHSLAVAELMYELATRLDLEEKDRFLAKTIGLLHDLGRFEQLKRFHSFDDKLLDHADYAVDYLFKQSHIREFIDDNTYDNIIKIAIQEHNKYCLSEIENEKIKRFAEMIRDMDKTEIYNQLAKHYSYTFDGEITEKVLNDFNNQKCILKKECKTPSDRVVLSMACLYDYNYKESLDILKEKNYFLDWLNTIEVTPSGEKKFIKLKEKCKNIIKNKR